MQYYCFLIVVFLYVISSLVSVDAASDKKPHGHQGVLEPYSGKPLPMKLTSDQKKKLDKGEAVLYNERSGKSGRGVVIQDVNASIPITMSKIQDLGNYPKMVPNVKKVNIYHTQKFFNGTSKTGAKFDVGVMGIGFSYFLLLTHEPKYNTLTWTLDYSKNSDLDDNCGHWQLTNHPSKKGWTRILYSTKIKLFNWIPEFVVKFLTGKALTEATSWVKRESEAEQAKNGGDGGPSYMPSWMKMKGGRTMMKNMGARLGSVANDCPIYQSIDVAVKDIDSQKNRMLNQMKKSLIWPKL